MECRRGNARFIWTSAWLLWIGVVMLVPNLSRAVAADVEYRDFQVAIDGKPAGEYHLTINRRDDGTLVVTGQADVHVKYLAIYNYTYSYRGTETWKDGKLVRLDSTSNDDGKRFTVAARTDNNALQVTVNGQQRAVPADVWTTSCWRLPDAKYRNRALVLLDVDTGKEIAGTLQYVATGTLNVAGQAQDCAHYRVTGGTQLELWYDAQERLVRQESLEQGHRMVLEPLRIHR
jgi:hypothetical protein